MTTDSVAILAEEVMRHRNYRAAVMRYVQAMSESKWRHTPALVGKIMSQGPRIRLVLYVTWLYFTADPTDPDSGPALNRILEICAVRNETSQRAVTAMLGVMRLARYIELVRGTRDRRLKIYRPRPVLVDTVRDMFLRSFSAFDLIFEEAGWAERAASDEAFFREIYVTCGRPFIEGEAMVTERFPDLHSVMMMDGGFTVLLQLVKADLEGLPLPSTLALHRTTLVPRTQVWHIIQKAAEFGLVDLDQGRVVDVGRLSDTMGRSVATELAYYAVHMKYGDQLRKA